MSTEVRFTTENLDQTMKALAKAYRKLGGKTTPAEIILIGGAAVLADYGFREATYDIDAIIRASSAMEDAIRSVTDELNLPNGWLNEDFRKTASYTPKLVQYSRYNKTFYGVVTVRTVTAEYLVAMKMVSARQYKNDLSDIVGIIGEHQRRNTPLTFDMIDRAVQELYGSWERISEDTKALVKAALENPNASELYRQYRASEAEAEAILLDFQQEHLNQVRETDIASVLELARAKKKKQD